MDAHPGNSKLARALGSPDFHTREKAVAAMTRFLLRKPDIEEKDMLKIWKGLFYAFWHSDKTPVQVSAATLRPQLSPPPCRNFSLLSISRLSWRSALLGCSQPYQRRCARVRLHPCRCAWAHGAHAVACRQLSP